MGNHCIIRLYRRLRSFPLPDSSSHLSMASLRTNRVVIASLFLPQGTVYYDDDHSAVDDVELPQSVTKATPLNAAKAAQRLNTSFSIVDDLTKVGNMETQPAALTHGYSSQRHLWLHLSKTNRIHSRSSRLPVWAHSRVYDLSLRAFQFSMRYLLLSSQLLSEPLLRREPPRGSLLVGCPGRLPGPRVYAGQARLSVQHLALGS